MTRSILVLSQTLDGWRLFDDGRAIFWFPEKEAGLQVARTIAESRNFYSGKPTAVDLNLLQQPFERVVTYD